MLNETNCSYVTNLQTYLGWEFTERSVKGLDHFKFEEIDVPFWKEFISRNWIFPFYAIPVYLTVIFSLQRWMKNKEPFKLDGVLFLWNFVIAVFSIFGTMRTVPGLVKVLLQPQGFYKSICVKEGADAMLSVWVIAYIFSKFITLGDTLFLVLKKKPLVFAHWGHHCIAVFCCWVIAPYIEPVSRWCMILNLVEHALMYPYFVLRSFNVKVPIIVPNIITTYQFGMMLWGLIIHVITIFLNQAGYPCARDPTSIKICLMVTISFFLIFTKQFYESVILKGRDKKEEMRKLKAKELKSD